jgi:hypothetical protein
LTYKKAKFLALVSRVSKLRNAMALKIQSNYRRWVVKRLYTKVLLLEKSMPSIKWDAPSGHRHEVSLMGSFNRWHGKIPLIWCRLRQLHIRYFEGLKRGKEYEFKFIVDGSFQLSRSYDLVESMHPRNGFVNVLFIQKPKSAFGFLY